MAKRRPGGQPGNRNAAGHRGRNAFSAGRAQVRQAATARALKAGARGVTITGTVRGVEVRAFVSARPARQDFAGVRVRVGRR